MEQHPGLEAYAVRFETVATLISDNADTVEADLWCIACERETFRIGALVESEPVCTYATEVMREQGLEGDEAAVTACMDGLQFAYIAAEHVLPDNDPILPVAELRQRHPDTLDRQLWLHNETTAFLAACPEAVPIFTAFAHWFEPGYEQQAFDGMVAAFVLINYGESLKAEQDANKRILRMLATTYAGLDGWLDRREREIVAERSQRWDRIVRRFPRVVEDDLRGLTRLNDERRAAESGERA